MQQQDVQYELCVHATSVHHVHIPRYCSGVLLQDAASAVSSTLDAV
jgi:hypothetical protein